MFRVIIVQAFICETISTEKESGQMTREAQMMRTTAILRSSCIRRIRQQEDTFCFQ